MQFIGVDLTSAFSNVPRAIDIAVLDNSLHVSFFQAIWPSGALVLARDLFALRGMLTNVILNPHKEPQIWALDGPQGLAQFNQQMRNAERVLGTPARTPDTLPPNTSTLPFQSYIRSSIDLFAALLQDSSMFQLAGFSGSTLENATLYEIFPGSEWTPLSGFRFANKSSALGRKQRRWLLAQLGVQNLPQLPTADQNDALVGAYLLWCTRHKKNAVRLVDLPPIACPSTGEIREGHILHAIKQQHNLATTDFPDDVARDQVLLMPQITRNADWADGNVLLLRLTDYGLVHGGQPENSWLSPGLNYHLRLLPPDHALEFMLNHSAAFSGNRGWISKPNIKSLLAQLGYKTPPSISKDNSITLRVEVI